MNTFKDSISNQPEQIKRLPIILAVVLLAGLFCLVYQFKEEQRFAVAKEDIINFSKNYRYTKFPFNEKNYDVIIAEKGAFMSSGWLLLLMPAVFFYSIVFPRKFLKKHFKKEKKWSI